MKFHEIAIQFMFTNSFEAGTYTGQIGLCLKACGHFEQGHLYRDTGEEIVEIPYDELIEALDENKT